MFKYAGTIQKPGIRHGCCGNHILHCICFTARFRHQHRTVGPLYQVLSWSLILVQDFVEVFHAFDQ